MSAVPPLFDADPLGALHARFSRPLQRFFRSYRLNPADAQDLTQDVFLRMAGPATPVDLRAPDAFVFTLARNLVRDRARKMKVRNAAAAVSLDDIDLPNERLNPEEELQQSERLTQAQTVLNSLKPATREAFVHHRIHGASYAEVAKSMGISVSMVEKHLMAAIAALRKIDG
jgi:RNA polymerase sigma-70 factor (ECF subfamily)